MKKDKWIFQSRWLTFYFKWTFDISYELCGYFDPRHRINLDLFFFSLEIILPIRSKHTDECMPPKWGVSCHSNMLWIHRGGKGNLQGGNKWWTIYAPWSWQWVRTSALRKDGTWEHELPGSNKAFYEDKWNDVLFRETHPYRHIVGEGKQNPKVQDVLATIRVEEREWRWYWFKWLPFPRKLNRCIDVKFSDEVGARAGSWKGGTVGCGYTMRDGETPLMTLRRMERERKF